MDSTEHTNHPALATDLHPDIIYQLVVDGDLGGLSDGQRVAYYAHRCKALGIEPGEQPFQLITLSGKLRMYLTKAGANALTRVHGLSVGIKSIRTEGSLVIVEARAEYPDGRYTDDVGIVDLEDRSDAKLGKANATMKAVTKAKRRAVIGLVGLGMLDESELDSMGPRAQQVSIDGPAVIDTTSRPAQDGARCNGKAAGLASSIRRRCDEYAAVVERTASAVYSGALAKLAIPQLPDGTEPTPEQLLVTDGKRVRALLEDAMARREPPDAVEREPGWDDDAEPPEDKTDPTAQKAP